MAITQSQSKNSASVVNHAQGVYTDDAGTPAAATLTLGFIPRYVCWLNATDRIQYEWFQGMADGTTLKTVAAGTRTLDTVDVAITVNDTAGATINTVTIGAAAILQNKVNYWVAIG